VVIGKIAVISGLADRSAKTLYAAFENADRIVLIYPTWQGGTPALTDPWYIGAPDLKTAKRHILRLSGIHLVRACHTK